MLHKSRHYYELDLYHVLCVTEKKHGIFFKTAGEINDLYFFVRTENITSVQLTAFGNCSRVQIFVGVGV